MPWWQWLVDVAGLLVLLVISYGLALVIRRRAICRHGGTFELSYRMRSDRAGRGWVLGLGRYSGQNLEWFRVFSVAPAPKRIWARDTLSYDGRRQALGNEQMSLYPGHVVIHCRTPSGEIELAMSEASLTGFQSWLEAGPPGVDWSR